jgi:hypothetical protein
MCVYISMASLLQIRARTHTGKQCLRTGELIKSKEEILGWTDRLLSFDTARTSENHTRRQTGRQTHRQQSDLTGVYILFQNGPGVDSASNRNEYHESSWGKRRPARKSGNLHSHLWVYCLENVGASTSHSPMGLRYLITITNITLIFHGVQIGTYWFAQKQLVPAK